MFHKYIEDKKVDFTRKNCKYHYYIFSNSYLKDPIIFDPFIQNKTRKKVTFGSEILDPVAHALGFNYWNFTFISSDNGWCIEQKHKFFKALWWTQLDLDIFCLAKSVIKTSKNKCCNPVPWITLNSHKIKKKDRITMEKMKKSYYWCMQLYYCATLLFLICSMIWFSSILWPDDDFQ